MSKIYMLTTRTKIAWQELAGQSTSTVLFGDPNGNWQDEVVDFDPNVVVIEAQCEYFSRPDVWETSVDVNELKQLLPNAFIIATNISGKKFGVELVPAPGEQPTWAIFIAHILYLAEKGDVSRFEAGSDYKTQIDELKSLINDPLATYLELLEYRQEGQQRALDELQKMIAERSVLMERVRLMST